MFRLVSKFQPAGDQPQAIEKLVSGLKKGMPHQTLLGVTGSGKTFTVANVIVQAQKPALVIAHNKTLAAQLCSEFRELFPHNAVHYFVSYYDYYQPEAYMPVTDTYIEKEAMINQEIDRLRHAATTALLTRRDVIIVASVSCIYGLGAPEAYEENIVRIRKGVPIERKNFIRQLVQLQFTRTPNVITRGTFRLRGDQWEIMPMDRETVCRFTVRDGVVDECEPAEIIFAPAKHFITPKNEVERAIKAIQKELKGQLTKFEKEKKFLEAERLERRTKMDIAMMREVGYCSGIENYSRHLSGRPPGAAPDTLLEYFRSPTSNGSRTSAHNFLTIIDESHMTVPQIAGMYNGDRARKETLVEYGFRLPSAKDNRPLTFKEFEERVGQVIFTSATPGPYEAKKSEQTVEQIIRPTGLVDPEVVLHPCRDQIKDAESRIMNQESGDRTLVTTLTKKMAEDLSEYLKEKKIKAVYLHSDVKTLDRIRILTDFRRGKFDVLVGVNLLREGLDLPEVSLVLIIDADKEGFLRSETSLIQTIGRAARNVRGTVVLYADTLTGSITRAVGETNRRRALQNKYNEDHGITPRSIQKEIKDILPDVGKILKLDTAPTGIAPAAREKLIRQKEKEMKCAAEELDFELAAILRDEIKILQKKG